MNNPFFNNSLLNAVLSGEQCRRIEGQAMREVANGQFSPLSNPDNGASFSGNVGNLRYPLDLEIAFAGVMTEVYRTIETLFCSNIGRSVEIVWKILTKLAENADVPPISYEAVWSICGYLEQKRRGTVANRVEHIETAWELVQFKPNIKLLNPHMSFSPNIVCIFDRNTSRPVAFRICSPDNLTAAIGLALYDAVVTCRQPLHNQPNGLVWQLPSHFFYGVEIPGKLNSLLEQKLGIRVKRELPTGITAFSLPANWGQELANHQLTVTQLSLIFDGYLEKIFSYSPIGQNNQRVMENRDLAGFKRDPAVIFPALRLLLPECAGVILADGSVALNGLHYEDPLLRLWPGQQISLRYSPIAEATAWIYLDGDVLCQAMARELRRTDGSYRPNRPWREKNDFYQSSYKVTGPIELQPDLRR